MNLSNVIFWQLNCFGMALPSDQTMPLASSGPWFHSTLTIPSMSDIEVRSSGDEATENEDSPLKLLDVIAVKLIATQKWTVWYHPYLHNSISSYMCRKFSESAGNFLHIPKSAPFFEDNSCTRPIHLYGVSYFVWNMFINLHSFHNVEKHWYILHFKYEQQGGPFESLLRCLMHRQYAEAAN